MFLKTDIDPSLVCNIANYVMDKTSILVILITKT